MLFIEGIGYVDENVYGVNGIGNVNATNQTNTTNSTTSAFDDILATETANLNDKEKTYNLDDIFNEASAKYNVDVNLLKAIAYNESRFQPDVTSQAGAMGIMQLMPSTAKAMGVENAYDPYESIMGGAKLLNTLSDMFDGDTTLMIAAYNAGAGNVEKYDGVPPFSETKAYVENVLNTLKTGVETEGITVTAQSDIDTKETTAASALLTDTISTTDSTFTSSASDILSTALLQNTGTADGYTYEQYKLLMTYFENMMDIISSMGETTTDDESEKDSLNSLFELARTNITYNRSTINL